MKEEHGQTNAANKRQIEKQKQTVKWELKQRKLDLLNVLSTPSGRKIFLHYLKLFGVFSGNASTETNRMFFNLGRRDAGMDIWKDINDADPNVYGRMVSEYNEELAKKKMKKEADDGGGNDSGTDRDE